MAKRPRTATRTPETELKTPADTTIAPRNRALVFISHDTRDAEYAEAFGNLLTDASGGVLKSFRSSDRKGTEGIEFGAEWYPSVMAALNESTDVVALLTQHSINRPWILYEAGVAKGKLDTTVFGVALGVPLDLARTGPFAQFQNCSDDEDSLTKLVLQLIRRNPDAAPREEAVRRQVQAFRVTVSGILKARGKSTPQSTHTKVDEPAIAKLFEEVKVMFASLPEKIEEKMSQSVRPRSILRRGRIHPMMFEEFLFHPELQEGPEGPAIGWLLLLSAIREDMPWLYDLGMELYNALRTQDMNKIDRAKTNLISALKITERSKFMRHLFMEGDKDTFMFYRHVPDIMMHYLNNIESVIRRKKKKQSVKGLFEENHN